MSHPYLRLGELEHIIALLASVQPRVVIEFGCNLGRTAKAILDRIPGIECYIGIDVPYEHETTLPCQQSEVPASPGLFVQDNPRFWLLLQPGGSRTLVASDLEPCDAAFIDGDHSKEGVLHDSRLARALVRSGGIIVWHDYGNEAVEVTQALDGLGWPIQTIPDTWLAFMVQQ